MNFKETVIQDIDVFFNDFAEPHKINGNSVDIVVDNDRLQHRSKKEYDGIVVGDTLIFIKKTDLSFVPKPDQAINYDGIPSLCFDVREDMGMYEIILKMNVS